MYIKSKVISRKSKVESPTAAPKTSFVWVLILLLGSCIFSLSANAQCAMCRAAIESEGDGTKAAAVNDGIVYLMAFPYIMVAIVFYVVYRMKFKKKPASEVSS